MAVAVSAIAVASLLGPFSPRPAIGAIAIRQSRQNDVRSFIPVGKPSLTVFVDDGKKDGIGHVFVMLSDGRAPAYGTVVGFYPRGRGATKDVLQVIAGATITGAVFEDERHGWNVRSQPYVLTDAAYKRAVATVNGWKEATKNGAVRYNLYGNSCGDFAVKVASAAGVNLKLPFTLTKDNRPENFAAFLRSHGGIENAGSGPRPDPDARKKRQKWQGFWEMPAEGNLKAAKIPTTLSLYFDSAGTPHFDADTSSMVHDFHVLKSETDSRGNWVLHCESMWGHCLFTLTGSDTITGTGLSDPALKGQPRSGQITLKRESIPNNPTPTISGSTGGGLLP